ncbi:MAG TPA: glycosyltransferase family 39 protein, partial [Flavobacteriales bacterium]|nr:glycosyltransferase family 39 protein [Flavobacteriales bacterium]
MEAESGITGLTKSSGMRALKYASIALAIALTVTTLASRISLINTHLLNIMGEEQNVVYGIIKWMQGSPLYTDPAILPMDIIQYAPSYYYLVGSIGKLIGVDPSEPQNIYALSRTVGLLLNLLFAFIGYGIARQMGAIRWVGILWGAVVFSFLPVQIYSRTDALNLVFFASAMFFFLRSLERGTEGKKILYLATIFGCLAMLSKQTGVLPLIIIGSWLLITKQWKTLFYQIIVGAVILGVAVGSMFIHYGTGVVIDNLFTSVRNGIDLVLVRSLLNVRYVAMFVLQGIGLVLAFRWWRGTEPMKRGWALAFTISLVFGYITSL